MGGLKIALCSTRHGHEACVLWPSAIAQAAEQAPGKSSGAGTDARLAI